MTLCNRILISSGRTSASLKHSTFYEILGNVYFAKRDTATAQQAFEKALTLNESSTEARLQLARVYASQGRVAEAIQSGQKLLNDHPDFLSGYILLGTL